MGFLRPISLVLVAAWLGSAQAAPKTEPAPDPDWSKGIHSESDCTDVQLDDPGGNGKPRGPMADVPVRDQSALGSCTAHAAAEMIDAYLAKKYPPPSLNGPPKHVTSPLALYVEHQLGSNFSGPFDGSSGSDIPSMIKQAKKTGSCDLNDASYNTENFEQLNNCLVLYDDMVSTGHTSQKIEQLSGGITDLKGQKDWLIHNRILCRAEHHFHLPEGTLDVAKVTQYLEKHQHVKFWKDLIEQKCVMPATKLDAKTIDLPKLKVLTRLKGNKPNENKSVHDLQKAIDEQLDKASQPVGIGYCTGFFSYDMPHIDDGADLLTKILYAKDPAEQKAAAGKCGMHASVIIGRKWRRGGDGQFRCMYKIQNSWGSDASSCLLYADNRWLPSTRQGERGSSDCEDGKIWIDQDELGNVADVNFFEGGGK